MTSMTQERAGVKSTPAGRLTRGNRGDEPVEEMCGTPAYLGPFEPDEPEWAAWALEHGLWGLDASAIVARTLYGERTAEQVYSDYKREKGYGGSPRRLSDEEVRAIRAAYAAGGCRQAELGRAYGVHTETISQIVGGRTYRWVGGAA